jgi:hypothetical protein
MPRCAESACGRWRPDLTTIDRFAGTTARRVGALQFNGNWYCSRACVEQAALLGLGEPAEMSASARPLPRFRLGLLLRLAGAITETQLDTALVLKARSGLKIGDQLEQLGFVSPEIVLRSLAKQAGVSYLSTFDVTRVTRAPITLSKAMVQALGLVPFEVDAAAAKLLVVCTAPVPRAAMRALAKLTGWTPEVYMVTDGVFNEALDAYRPVEEAHVPHDSATVRTLVAAAARVADSAQADRSVTMRHAQYDDCVWVRVEGSQRVSDVLVTQKETGCQAELTAH